MNAKYLEFDTFEQISDFDKKYACRSSDLHPFIKYPPVLDAFAEVINDKEKDDIDRELLYNVLKSQYSDYVTDTTQALPLIDKLKDNNTYTIVTAHQPVLFTGPAYMAYKILSAVKLSQKLQEAYPEYQFVPVFVTGGEDHDFDEMNHLHMFGKRVEWENDEHGSVGRMSTKNLAAPLTALKDILGASDLAQETYSIFEKTHTHHSQYNSAFADMINGLFGKLGMVVLNMDSVLLKKRMIDIFRDDLLHHHSQKLVQDTQKRIEKTGLKPQAYARQINLFYLDKGVRNRIEKIDAGYQVVDCDIIFSEAEMISLVENEPERLSPNVVLRPLYQERILPNLAFVGGGGELAYWLERKSQFEFYGINFPMLVRRDSALWIDGHSKKKMNKLQIPLDNFFQPEVSQIKSYVAANAEHEFNLDQEVFEMENIWKKIEQKAASIDPSLQGKVAATGVNQVKAMDKIADRMRKAEKQKHDVAISQIKGIRSKLYPNGGLQERHANYLEFYLRHPDDFFEIMLKHFDPLDIRLKVFHP